jgi:NAD(P)-dependent dehydrogenase (short-subunit alcohol dehydrogenase family)
MKGKVCLITGATAGIGEVTALELARLGATVVIASRSPQRCADTVARIREATGNPAVDFIAADLSSQAQVRRLAEEFQRRSPRLDVLVNNAGGFFMRRARTVDGLEMTWALDHLSYFLLTLLLLDTLQASAPSRIVNVASDAHQGGRIHFDDLQGERSYRGFRAYAQAKLANILFTYELARRLEGTGVTVNALHPGFVATRFAKNNSLIVRLGASIAGLFALTPAQGARTSIYLASSPEVEGVTGQYFVKCKPARSSPASYDRETARRLWEVSLAMTDFDEARG